MKGLTMCDGGERCILDRQICDGKPDCPHGDDELGLVASDGVRLQCDMPGGLCRYKGVIRNFSRENKDTKINLKKKKNKCSLYKEL